jgi:branched-subunit amino acid ABC-type transport system permease component
MMIAAFLGIDSFREVVQTFANGLISGGAYGLMGAALALILSTTGRFHFALIFNYTLAAFLAAVLQGAGGVPFLPAVLIGLAAGTLSGVLCEALVYRPLARRAGADALLTVFVASLGLVIAGENAIRLIWGSDTRTLTGPADKTINISSIVLSATSVVALVVYVLIALGLTLVLARTSAGRQIKAVRVNPTMAAAVGVDVGRVFLLVFAIGAFMAGVVAIFSGVRFAVTASMGTTPVFYALVVAFFAGTARGPLWQMGAGLGVGVVESLSTLWLNSKLSSVVVFGLLMVFLCQATLRESISRTLRRRRNRTRRHVPAERPVEAA